MDKFVTLAEASTLLGLSKEALRKRYKRGTIEGYTGNDRVIMINVAGVDTGMDKLDKVGDFGEDAGIPVSTPLPTPQTEEIERLYNIIQGQQRTIDKLTAQLDKGQAERREVLALLSKAQDVILDLKEQKKIADDRSRKAIKIIKENAQKS